MDARLAALDRFLQILDMVEESDSGKEFHPTTISCCRAHLLDELSILVAIMRGT